MSPEGSIDVDTSSILDRELCRILAENIKTLVLDMAGVDFISSAGIGAVTKAKVTIKRQGGDIAMINVQPQVKTVFEIMRLGPVLNVFESIQELDEYLEKLQKRVVEEGTSISVDD
jgi:anti-anti-sigma factor